jgi:L-fucose isomerase-like protein
MPVAYLNRPPDRYGVFMMTALPRSLASRVAVGSLCSPLEVGADRAPRAAQDLSRLLSQAGCEVVELGPVDTPDKAAAAGRTLAEKHLHAVALAVASWFEDYLVLDLLEECGVPVLLWALPGMETGALCGAQQLTAYLKQLGAPYRCVYGPADDARGREQSIAFLHAAALRHQLRRARVGFGGYRVTGMSEVSANEMALKKAIGPRIIPLDMPLLLARAAEMPDAQVQPAWEEMVGRSGRCRVPAKDGIDSLKVHAAVRELIAQYRLDALTIGCFPHLMGRVCLAASLLADEGIVLGCEGDVNGAVGQLMLTRLTGLPTHNTDWLEPLPDGTVVFTHCGSGSFSLAERAGDITLSPVRLMNRGVCALFPARPGPVTLVSLLPRGDGYQLALLEGEAISTEMVFRGNPLRVRFSRPTPDLIEWISDQGIGHHWMAGYGHVGHEIRNWAELCGPSLSLLQP